MRAEFAESVTLYRKQGETFFPLITVPAGDGQEFMLVYSGQINQLNVASHSSPDLTPHVSNPVQPANSVTGGNPCRTTRNFVENVTVSFATGHSKVLLGTDSPPIRDPG